jgi:quercetin 2,3-dioxygenase
LRKLRLQKWQSAHHLSARSTCRLIRLKPHAALSKFGKTNTSAVEACAGLETTTRLRTDQELEFVLKTLVDVLRDATDHWGGDGFPIRTVFSYEQLGEEISPFLLLDYAGPYRFEPAARPRGVGPHPHLGFETVTVVYEGEVTHSDSTGCRGTIGPGDVQWMTAGSGILHQEFHSAAFTKAGGPFRMVQLWVNLPADRKLTSPKYQLITADRIPVVEFRGEAARARVIAGSLDGKLGPAKTFTPINIWDLEIKDDIRTLINIPEGHTALVVVLSGVLAFDGANAVEEAEAALFSRVGEGALLTAVAPTKALVLTGAPIDEPIVGRGPFVMNTENEVRQAFRDFGGGRFGASRRDGS